MEKPVIRKSTWNSRKINFDKFDAMGNIVDKYLGGQPIPVSVEEFAAILSKPPIRRNETNLKRPRHEEKESIAVEPKKRGRPSESATVEKEAKKQSKKCLAQNLFGFTVDNAPIRKQISDFFQAFTKIVPMILRYGHGAVLIVKYLRTITWMFWNNRGFGVTWACENYSIILGEEACVTLLKTLLQEQNIEELLFGLHLISSLLSTQKLCEFPNERESTIKNMSVDMKSKLDEAIVFQSSQDKTFVEKLRKYSEFFSCYPYPLIRSGIFFLFPIQYSEDEKIFDAVVSRGKLLCESVGTEYDAWLKSLHKLLQTHIKSVKSSRDKIEKSLKSTSAAPSKPSVPASTAASTALPKAVISTQPKLPVSQSIFPTNIPAASASTSKNISTLNQSSAGVTVAASGKPDNSSTVVVNKAAYRLAPVELNFFQTMKSAFGAAVYNSISTSFMNFKMLCVENVAMEARQKSFDQFCALIPPQARHWIATLRTLYPAIKQPPATNLNGNRDINNVPVTQRVKSSIPTTTTFPSGSKVVSSVTAPTISTAVVSNTIATTVPVAASAALATKSTVPHTSEVLPFTLRHVSTVIQMKYGFAKLQPLSPSSIYHFYEQLLLNQKKLLLNAGYRAELMMAKETPVSGKEESALKVIEQPRKDPSIFEKLQSDIAPHNHTNLPIDLSSLSEEQKQYLCSIDYVIECLQNSRFSYSHAIDKTKQLEIILHALKAYFFRPEQSIEAVSTISNFYEIPLAEFTDLISRVQRSMRSGILEEARGNNDHSHCENATSDVLGSSNIENTESNMDVDQPSETPKGTLSLNESQCMDLTNGDDDVTIQQQQEYTNEKLDMDIDHGTVTDEVNPPQSHTASESANDIQSEPENNDDRCDAPPPATAESNSNGNDVKSPQPLSPTKSTSAVVLDDNHVILGMKCVSLLQDKNTIATRYFRIGKHNKVKKLIKKYCERLSIPISSVQLSWRGMILQPTDTIHSIGLVNYSEVLVSIK